MKITGNFLSTLLALHRLPGLGPVKLKAILEDVCSPPPPHSNSHSNPSPLSSHTLFSHPNPHSFADIAFAKDGRCLLFPGHADWKMVEQDLAWVQKSNHHIITFFDECYPKLLKEIHSAPPILFVAGDIHLLSAPQIAMVGSRNPTSTGREIACHFAKQLAEQGLCITSGLASGIDAASHKGALQVGGRTIAVLANGLDSVYPPINKKLSIEILEQGGAVVSEFPIGVKPNPSHFPRRNRIISGLSMGTLVVEATLNSGSLITAKYALDQGREVFAIPGSIYSSQAQGCHALLRQGAKLVETPKDVLEEMESLLKYVSQSDKLEGNLEVLGTSAGATPELGGGLGGCLGSGLEEKVFNHIGFEPTALDTLLQRSGLTMSQVSSILLELELKGYIESCIGGYIRMSNLG